MSTQAWDSVTLVYMDARDIVAHDKEGHHPLPLPVFPFGDKQDINIQADPHKDMSTLLSTLTVRYAAVAALINRT